MSIRPTRWGALGLAGILIAGGLLSGCSVSGEQLRPGVAAQVGDTELSLNEIDEAIDTACSFFSDSEQVGFPRSLARQQFVSVLVMRAAAAQALEENDLELGADYAQRVGGLDAANAQVPEDQRAPFVLLSEGTTYIDSASTVLGQAAFNAEGDVPADPALITERGRSEISTWLEDNEVEINPVFRLSVDNGQVVNDTTGVSVAVSDYATTSLLDPNTATEEQVTASAAQLPPSQLCGVSS
ncbi:hypothetical protein BH09ACT12_BH09ACT12_23140 [soil metagenome]